MHVQQVYFMTTMTADPKQMYMHAVEGSSTQLLSNLLLQNLYTMVALTFVVMLAHVLGRLHPATYLCCPAMDFSIHPNAKTKH